jgi:hypothetical protein
MRIVKKFLSEGAVANLLNNVFMKARNAANSADVDIIKLNASDRIQFASTPQSSDVPTVNADLVNKLYVDGLTGSGATTALDNLTTTAINIALIPDSDGIYDLGSSSLKWSTLFASEAHIDTLRDLSNVVAVDVANKTLKNTAAATVLDFSGTNLSVNTRKITSVVDPTSAQDAATKAYADLKLALAGGTMSGNIAMGGSKVTGLGAPSANGDALRFDQLGANSGIATLDGGGKVPASQLPSTLMDYLGNWNASTNSPTLADGAGSAGDVYLVSVAGSQNLGSGSISFAVGDWIIYNGTIWQKSLNSNAVVSVNGFTGTVVLTTDDVAQGSTNKYQKTWGKENLTLNGTDITNQYKDLAQVIIASSLDLVVNGVVQVEGSDYTVSLTGGAGGKTRISFAGDLATGGAAALISGDIVRFKYQY